MPRLSVSIVRLFPSGAWEVSAVVRGFLVSRRYSGYTKREALRLFREEME